MRQKFRAWWQQIKKHQVLSIGITLIVLIVLGVSIVLTVSNGAGFEAYSTTTTSKLTSGTAKPVVSSTVMNQPGKTLWDLLQLLIIPVVLAVGGFAINFTVSRSEQRAVSQRDKTDRAITEDNQREAALQGYIDKMSELLLEKNLRESNSEDEVRTIARVRTLTALYRFGGKRKGSVLQFLHESKLIDQDKSIVSLEGANLRRVDLLYFDLTGASLYKADLFGADLTGCILKKSNLIEANLSEAKLSKTDLSGASLYQAKLCEADLTKAILAGTMLSKADLSRAILFEAFLAEAKLGDANLSGADLTKADFGGANLSGADLSRAYLRETNLTLANLTDADLTGADLLGAKVDQKRLNLAKSLKGATMPDGTIHP